MIEPAFNVLPLNKVVPVPKVLCAPVAPVDTELTKAAAWRTVPAPMVVPVVITELLPRVPVVVIAPEAISPAAVNCRVVPPAIIDVEFIVELEPIVLLPVVKTAPEIASVTVPVFKIELAPMVEPDVMTEPEARVEEAVVVVTPVKFSALSTKATA